jgi:acyl-CoA thioester hydrolase
LYDLSNHPGIVGFKHTTKIRVRYGETDQMGYVYYGHYCEYYEVGRVEALRSLGVTYRELEEKHRILLPVVSLQVRYLRPARYDDMLEIITHVRELDGPYLKFHTEIKNKRGQIVNEARVKLVFMHADTGKSMEPPGFLKDMLESVL